MNLRLPTLLLALATGATATATAAPATKPTAALETLLACRPGSDFTQAQAEQALRAAGLTPVPGGVFQPKGGKVALLGGSVTSADVSVIAGGQKSIHVYLQGITAAQVGRSLSVTTVNDDADTEAPSYIRKVDARHTQHVGAADDYEGYSAAVSCQISP